MLEEVGEIQLWIQSEMSLGIQLDIAAYKEAPILPTWLLASLNIVEEPRYCRHDCRCREA